LLIFVFEGVSGGRARPILAEFAAVPNVPSAVAPAATDRIELPPSDVRTASKYPTPGVPPPTAEIGGPKGPEPTRFGDWERNGRCVDF
jgi:hypothetical protein